MLIATLIAGCGEMPKRAASEEEATAAAGYGRAFGRVEYLEGGKEVVWGTSFFTTNTLTLFVRSLPSAEMHYLEVESDGTFYWPLPAGEYEIVGFQMLRISGTRSTRTGRLMTKFSLPQAGQAVYVGDVRINAARGGFQLVDRYAETLKRVEARLAEGKLQAVKGLMGREQPPGSVKRMSAICDAMWELKCGGSYQGVEPTSPEGTAQRFPLIEILTPRLEWKPSTRPGVTYDVIVFESLRLHYNFAANTADLRGSVVAYAEGLREPSHSFEKPFAPGKRYEWSVRLRDGDTVSSWSTTSHSLFLVVGASSGSGRSFGFETPAQ
jgi:hypothetical protein